MKGIKIMQKLLTPKTAKHQNMCITETTDFNPTLHGSFRGRYPTACWADWPNNDDDLVKIKDGCVGLICPTRYSHRSTQHLGGKSGGTLHTHLEHLQVELRRSGKSSIFLRMSGFRHFFQILEIPLLSPSN